MSTRLNRTVFPLFERKSALAALVAAGIVMSWITQASGAALDKVGTQWSPFLEWSLENPSFAGNPYDLIATVTFTHTGVGESHTTEMFYDGGNTWKYRFTGTRSGTWTFTTSSSDADLDGRSGTVEISPNTDTLGFVTNVGNKWARHVTGEGEVKAFVPQFAMINGPQGYFENPAQVDAEIQTFLIEHGFNGVHVPGSCRWFNLNQPRCDQVGSSNPDRQTFEAFELLITKVHAAGGVVHIWVWGDSQRQWNIESLSGGGGINGVADKRLQRYIAARLGPLPGWTMGYGFDLFEWVTGSQLDEWHDYMQDRLGWTHYLGARSSKNQLNQLSEKMDYSSYEQHKPDYDKYVETIEARPEKPSFSEDRFRIRGRAKDYSMEETRRGLWDSTMAGGIANIWGNLQGAGANANDGLSTSAPYPNPEWIKTNALFFVNRFMKDMVRCSNLTDGVCLKTSTNADYIVYKENTSSIQMNLSEMAGSQQAIAIDATKVYAEIDLGLLGAANQTWSAPYVSDWAIAVGNFSVPTGPAPDVTSPQAPTNLRVIE